MAWPFAALLAARVLAAGMGVTMTGERFLNPGTLGIIFMLIVIFLPGGLGSLGFSQTVFMLTQYVPYDFDQRHIFTFVGGYNLPWGLDLSTRFRLVTGNPTTPILGSVYDADTNGYTPLYGPQHSDRNPIFHQLDVRLDKKFVFKSWILGVYLDVTNVYNHRNAEGTRYNYDYSDSEPVRGLPPDRRQRQLRAGPQVPALPLHQEHHPQGL